MDSLINSIPKADGVAMSVIILFHSSQVSCLDRLPMPDGHREDNEPNLSFGVWLGGLVASDIDSRLELVSRANCFRGQILN